jgi:hypothetical protein
VFSCGLKLLVYEALSYTVYRLLTSIMAAVFLCVLKLILYAALNY